MSHLSQNTPSKPAYALKFVFGENRENPDHSEMVRTALRMREDENATGIDNQCALDASALNTVDSIGKDFTRSQMAWHAPRQGLSGGNRTQPKLTPLEPLVAARLLCEESGWKLSNLDLQKILYLGQVASLGTTQSQTPFVRAEFRAWKYGPVSPIVYHTLKIHKADPIPEETVGWVAIDEEGSEVDQEFVGFVGYLIRTFGNVNSSMLVAMTHVAGGAWGRARNGSQRNAVIPDEDIAADFDRIFQSN